jgi:hypothetical protein
MMWSLLANISTIFGLAKLLFSKKRGDYTNIVENIKDASTKEQKELIALTEPLKMNKKGKRKEGNLKPEHCPTTLRMAINYNVVILFVTVVVLCGIFGAVIYKMYTSQQMVYMELVTNKLEKSAEIKQLVEELKLIEAGVVEANKETGFTVHSWDRLTDKEFFDLAILLNKYSQDESVFDWRGFAASISSECNWNKHNRSNMGAVGVSQILQDTFDWCNEKDGDFEKRDINSVYYNARAGIRYSIFIKGYLTTKLGRTPALEEIYGSYNVGHTFFARVMNSPVKDKQKLLPAETVRHQKKIRFYYDNIVKKNYKVTYKD